MSKIKFIALLLLLTCLSYLSNAQLIGHHKFKKYLLATFKVLQDQDLPNIGTIYEAKIYFKHDTLKNKAVFVMEHLAEAEFIVGELTRNDAIDLFENQKNEALLDYIKVSSSEIEFTKSPWENLGLKKGFLQFTAIEDKPRRFLAYLYLNLPDQRSIRMAGYVEDDLLELQNSKKSKKSKK